MKIIGIVLFFFFSSLICQGQDTIYLNEPTTFTEWIGSVDYSHTELSSEKFVIAYVEGGFWKGKLRIGNLRNDTIIEFKNPKTFTSEDIQDIKVTKLSSSKFLLTYRNGSNTKCMVCKIDDSDIITIGESFTLLEYDYTDDLSQISISENKFLIAYYDSEYGIGKCALGFVNSNLEISLDSTYSLNQPGISSCDYISIDTLSRTQFIIAFGGMFSLAVNGSINDNDEITFGDSYQFTYNESYHINIVGLKENQFAIVYADEYDVMNGTVVIGNSDQNKQLTFSNKFFFNENITREISAEKLSSEEILIAFNAYGSNYTGYILKAIVNNNIVNYSEKVIFNDNAPLLSSNILSSLDDKKVIVSYMKDGSNLGYLRICDTDYPLIYRTDEIKACDSYSWMDGNIYTSSNNTATYKVVNPSGSDTLITLDLTINYSDAETDVITVCNSYTWIDGNTYTSSNNIATHTLTNINGCDSIVTLDLTINTVDVSVTENGFKLTANESGASYQWIDCNYNYNPITGEISQSFTPTENGSYAVVVDNELCIDTSACYTITGVGINEIDVIGISLYPNPTNDVVNINLGENHIHKISIADISGRTIIETIPESKNEKLDLSDFESGLYIIIFKTNKEIYTSKILKE